MLFLFAVLFDVEGDMTKEELIARIHKNNPWGLSKKGTEEIVTAVFASISKAIKKERRFRFFGFGIWHVKTRKARNGRHPQTGQEIRIRASKTVRFKPAKQFKSIL
jgi:DNA-binding protein HU-beta